MKFWFERGAWASPKTKAKIKLMQSDAVRSIAVIRHAALGDMVLVRAFLIELRRHFPNARITLSIVSNYTLGVPEDLVDRIHVIDGSDRRDVPRREQIRKIRALGYHDLLFDLAATSRSFWVCLLNNAGLKIGFPYRTMQRHLFYDACVLRTDFRFEAEVMLDMLHLLGFKTAWPPDFALDVEAVNRERPCIVYFTSASNKSKCWPDADFAQLVGELAVQFPQHDHVVLEGVADWESIDAVVAPHRDKSNVIAMKAGSLASTMSLLKSADLVISNDTGIRNLAIVLETPTLGIFFATVPYRYWPRYGYHDVVFEPDGRLPAVETVAASAVRLLQEAGAR